MASSKKRSSRQLLRPLPLQIDSVYGPLNALAWWLSEGEIRFSCERRILPGPPRTLYVKGPEQDPILLQVMVRKASTLPTRSDGETFLHKGTYRVLRKADEPRLRRLCKQGDPQNPVRAPTLTGSVTPKRRKRSKAFPSSQALRAAMARGRGDSDSRGWWAPEGVPALLDTSDVPSLYVDLSSDERLARCVDRRTETLRLHVAQVHEMPLGEPIAVVIQRPDRSFEQLEGIVERHHRRGTVLRIESKTPLGLAPPARSHTPQPSPPPVGLPGPLTRPEKTSMPGPWSQA